MTHMIPFAIILGYFSVAVVLAILTTKFDKISWEYNYDHPLTPSFTFNFGVCLIWPVTIWFLIWYYVPCIKPLYDHVKAAKARNAKQQSEKFKLEKRKAMIREINADVDRFEDTRRDDVLSGRPIIDVRSEKDQKFCYVCNKAKSPYTGRYDEHGTLINTISGVHAHEECLMRDLEEA